jgi:hypothetical protein
LAASCLHVACILLQSLQIIHLDVRYDDAIWDEIPVTVVMGRSSYQTRQFATLWRSMMNLFLERYEKAIHRFIIFGQGQPAKKTCSNIITTRCITVLMEPYHSAWSRLQQVCTNFTYRQDMNRTVRE